MFRLKKVLFLLFPLFLLLPVSLGVFISSGTFTQPPPSSEQGGLGGAFGATSYTLPLTATATPTVAPPTVYGGSGAGGACLGTLGAGNDMIKMDFGWPASVLNKKWRDYTSYRLCNDRYTWETVTALPLKTVLQTLQWPSDLVAPQYANQVVTLEPLSTFDPVTQQAQQQAQQQKTQQSATETNKACLWHIGFAFVSTDIDICEPIRILVNAGSMVVHGIYQNTIAQIHFLWQTPLQPFQDDKTSGLLTIWSTSWAIVLACITAVLAYGGLRYMLGSAVNWLAYANLVELLPRLLFGLLAAYFSKEFFLMLIQANNALAGIFNHDSMDTVINGKVSGVVDESLQIVYCLMGFCLMIEEAARIAILYLLFAFAPILFFFASLRETQRWAKTAAVAAVIFAFMQAVQTATLDVGGRVLTTVLKNTDGNLSFLNLLISLAILYITLMLFFTLARMALGGGIYPFANGAFAMSSRFLPAAAGAVGAASATYRQARRNLFAFPGPDGRSPGSPGWRTPGGPGGSSGSGGSSGGQTGVTVGEKPFVKSANNKPGASGPDGKASGGPVRPDKNKPGPSGAGGNTSGGSALARTPLTTLNTTSGAPLSGASRVSGPGVRSGGPSSTNQTGQWQKTPPQTQRRRMSEEELLDWLNEQDSH